MSDGLSPNKDETGQLLQPATKNTLLRELRRIRIEKLEELTSLDVQIPPTARNSRVGWEDLQKLLHRMDERVRL
jgi:hypothetical protein